MAFSERKIINDPVYGFIKIDDGLLLELISHPFFQRLRRVYQMALAHLVYPGAVHTRFHHSMGAYHLMSSAISELCSKGIEISEEEATAAKAAILLHDIGHGPFSHALEGILLKGVHHEDISLSIMHRLNERLGGRLDLAIAIFTDRHPKRFLHQLVSGQLDVDRMDYLTRDSFYTGVSEGVIGYDRILKMLDVNNGELVVEEKGIYSIEKFLVARRLMYWQVYLHKTVLAAEKMLVKICQRVMWLHAKAVDGLKTGTAIDFFISNFNGELGTYALDKFGRLDDFDFMHAIKIWSSHPDVVLSTLCSSILDRKLLKIKMQAHPFTHEEMQQKIGHACQLLNVSEEEATYLVFGGELVNTMYKTGDEHINILFKSGEVRNISQVDNALIHKTLASPVKKFYICYLD